MPPPLDVTLPPLTNADTAGARVAWPVAPAAAMPVPYASPFAATIAFAFSIAVSATFPVAVTVALLLEAEVAGATRTVATAPAAAKPTRPSDADQLFTVAVPDDVSVAFSVRAPPTLTLPLTPTAAATATAPPTASIVDVSVAVIVIASAPSPVTRMPSLRLPDRYASTAEPIRLTTLTPAPAAAIAMPPTARATEPATTVESIVCPAVAEIVSFPATPSADESTCAFTPPAPAVPSCCHFDASV